jgi:hypothetical protein
MSRSEHSGAGMPASSPFEQIAKRQTERLNQLNRVDLVGSFDQIAKQQTERLNQLNQLNRAGLFRQATRLSAGLGIAAPPGLIDRVFAAEVQIGHAVRRLTPDANPQAEELTLVDDMQTAIVDELLRARPDGLSPREVLTWAAGSLRAAAMNAQRMAATTSRGMGKVNDNQLVRFAATMFALASLLVWMAHLLLT